MTNVFLSFLEISIPISLIIAVLLLLTPFLKRYAAKWKYWIWIVLALRLLVPIGWNSGQPVADIQLQRETLISSESEKISPNALSDRTARRRVVVEIPAQMTAPIVMKPERTGGNISMLDIIALFWMLGSLLIISVHLVSYVYYKRQILKKGKIVKDHDVLRLLLKLKHELHINCMVSVIECPEAASPLLIGFFNHILVLPEEQYNSEELFFILKHELIHLKRGDIYFKLLFVAANAVHWFHPLIWIMQKEAAVDMELSCDERVTQGTDYATRKAYTETLLSALHKQSKKKTVLSTGFYGGKQIMKKRFKNILAKKRKKNGAAVLICAIMSAVSLGTLVGCSITKENIENGYIPLGTKNSEIKNVQAENSKTDGPLPESGGKSSEMEQLSSDYSVSIGNLTISLYEQKQGITDKLNESGMNYNEYNSEMKYSDSDYNKYDSYCMIGESPLGTDESQWVDALLCAYFKDDLCVRLELLNEVPQTALGINLKDSCSRLIEQYGDSFQKQTYAAHGVYDVYRYSFDNYICEFTILEDSKDSICGVDIYAPSLYPIYDYGEELIN